MYNSRIASRGRSGSFSHAQNLSSKEQSSRLGVQVHQSNSSIVEVQRQHFRKPPVNDLCFKHQISHAAGTVIDSVSI